MNRLIAASLLGFVAAALPLTVLATPAEDRATLGKLDWKAGVHNLGASHGKFVVPSDGEMVQDDQAKRADEIINGTKHSDSEGLVHIGHDLLYLEYNDSGYVSIDDWSDIKPDEMLKQMQTATADANDERRKNGADEIYVDSWVQQPTLDRKNNTVTYVIGLHDQNHHPFVNAIAIALGRHGYEHFTLASDAGSPTATVAELQRLVKAYTFDPGFRFTDFVKGDRVAEVGIAALVGTAVGATIAKTVGFAAVLLFIKKFFLVIVAAAIAAFRWLRKKLPGGQSPAAGA